MQETVASFIPLPVSKVTLLDDFRTEKRMLFTAGKDASSLETINDRQRRHKSGKTTTSSLTFHTLSTPSPFSRVENVNETGMALFVAESETFKTSRVGFFFFFSGVVQPFQKTGFVFHGEIRTAAAEEEDEEKVCVMAGSPRAPKVARSIY